LASTCNVLGQNIGYCVSQLSFLTLNNKHTCFSLFKKYVKYMHLIFSESNYYKDLYNNMDLLYPTFQPFVDMNIFLKSWGIFILIITLLTFFKSEVAHVHPNNQIKTIKKLSANNCVSYNAITDDTNNNNNILCDNNMCDNSNKQNSYCIAKETYKNLYEIIFLPPMKIFIMLFLINRLPFASVEVGTNLKMLKRGITKEEFAIFNPFFIPLSIISPAIIGKIIKSSKPLNIFYYGYILRYISNLILSTLLPITHYVYSNKFHLYPFSFYSYYLYIFLAQVFNHLCIDIMTVSSMNFSNIVSDPHIGGTYMTFLNTINNLGSHWSAIFLLMFDYTDKTVCFKGKCVLIDGFYVQMIISLLIGLLIHKFILNCLKNLQNFPLEEWRISYTTEKEKNI
ncbi:acetyl-CoA transporter, putative, partial [Hepatocystis sp. ex Piliocolobus tephrosceles]